MNDMFKYQRFLTGFLVVSVLGAVFIGGSQYFSLIPYGFPLIAGGFALLMAGSGGSAYFLTKFARAKDDFMRRSEGGAWQQHWNQVWISMPVSIAMAIAGLILTFFAQLILTPFNAIALLPLLFMAGFGLFLFGAVAIGIHRYMK